MKTKNLKQALCASVLVSALSSCGTSNLTDDPLAKSNPSALFDENGNAQLAPEAPIPNSEELPSTSQNQEVGISEGHTYLLKKDLEVNVLGVPDGQYREFLGKKVTIPNGTTLAVLETKMVEEKGLMLRLGIDANEESGLPSDIWISVGDIPEGALTAVEDSDYTNEETSAYSPNDSYADMVRKAKKKMTYCYRYVKQYLLKTGKVKTYLPGVSAHMAGSTLPKYGFRKTGHTASTAQEGEVCVYRGGNGGNGHIEVKRNGKWWYGYGFKSTPITPRNHPFVGCYAK